jgi:hypothetical protein
VWKNHDYHLVAFLVFLQDGKARADLYWVGIYGDYRGN